MGAHGKCAPIASDSRLVAGPFGVVAGERRGVVGPGERGVVVDEHADEEIEEFDGDSSLGGGKVMHNRDFHDGPPLGRALGLVEHGLQDVAFDDPASLAQGLVEAVIGQAIDVAHRAEGGLVEHGDGVAGKDLGRGAGRLEARLDLSVGINGGERVDVLAHMEPGVERPVSSEFETVLELGKPDENQAQEGAGIPLVVEPDMQVVEGILVQEVGLVEEEHGVEVFLGELLDMGRNGKEETARGGAL